MQMNPSRMELPCMVLICFQIGLKKNFLVRIIPIICQISLKQRVDLYLLWFSIYKISQFLSINVYWTLVYPRESLVITLVRLSVVRGPSVVRPSLNISETVHWFFLIFCIKLEHHKGTKVTEPDIWKKSWGVTNGGNPTLEVFLMFFVHTSASSH